MGVDQRPVKLGPSVDGLRSQVAADDVMKTEPGRRVEVIFGQQREVVEAAAQPTNLDGGELAGVGPIPSQHG